MEHPQEQGSINSSLNADDVIAFMVSLQETSEATNIINFLTFQKSEIERMGSRIQELLERDRENQQEKDKLNEKMGDFEKLVQDLLCLIPVPRTVSQEPKKETFQEPKKDAFLEAVISANRELQKENKTLQEKIILLEKNNREMTESSKFASEQKREDLMMSRSSTSSQQTLEEQNKQFIKENIKHKEETQRLHKENQKLIEDAERLRAENIKHKENQKLVEDAERLHTESREYSQKFTDLQSLAEISDRKSKEYSQRISDLQSQVEILNRKNNELMVSQASIQMQNSQIQSRPFQTPTSIGAPHIQSSPTYRGSGMKSPFIAAKKLS